MKKVTVTVREIIEMLAKCDWDSECSCVNKETKEEIKQVLGSDKQHKANLRITGISQSTNAGTQIEFFEEGW